MMNYLLRQLKSKVNIYTKYYFKLSNYQWFFVIFALIYQNLLIFVKNIFSLNYAKP